ncbi:MAG: hemolysin III family protein [Coriobacteriia bacterium]|nr:hemolysin III family protein [Coriobacteriia bacterium]
MTAFTETIKQYTLGEEIASSILHGVGVVLGLVGLPILLIFSIFSAQDVGYKIAASIIYCVTMILLYLSSTLYHSLTHEKAKRLFKIFDHASIYSLIAGTYTPLCLITLREYNGRLVLVILWSMTLVGMATEAFWVFRPKWVSVVIYLIMGWMALWVLPTLIRELPPTAVWLLIAGGLAYTIGTIFYVIKKVPYFHSVFHGWVLLGTFLHFFAILLYVIL